ncbi:S1 RNA-binding domain-containing protein [Bacteroides faecis]|jgi:30S ribosomal protein S1|uniref:S1 RNA-binding domain-containing protein n=1 Tax=Bacteroides faecis TaxID=674529 RepID=UPI00359C3DAB
MTNKLSIEQANPFGECNDITSSISQISTKVEFKTENGLVVTLPNNNSGLLLNATIEDINYFNLGDTIEVYLDSEGNVYRNDEKCKLYLDIISKAKTGHVFNAKVMDAVTDEKIAGLIVDIDGLQCFMPERQIGIEKKDGLQSFVGSTIDVKLISVKLKEKEGNRFLPIVSHKIIEDEKNVIDAQEKLQNIKVGSIIQGIVKNIVSYGVFVTISPSIDGLIHITDLSWKRISNPSEILFVGQHINVIILDIKQTNDGKTKISLGLKQLSKGPWERFDKNIKEGDVVSGSICNITDYGIFIMLPSGVQGLVHKTELSWNSNVTLNDFHKEQFVTAKIINIDWEKEKLLLSLKQLLTDPWENIENKISVGDIVETTIKSFTNFGIFVTIADGIDGLIHVSELSWTEKIKKPKNHYILGDHLNAVIISIDQDKKKIKLSHKLTLPNPWQKYTVGQHVNAIILEHNNDGILVKLENDNLTAFIPGKLISKDYFIEENGKLECLIQEIDENKRMITLAIV